ncbi:unnamed protein product [Amoebophrya sp. A120]|nr:unnamed protein product [Amoebophrya sp. A120]|eukprot:GSA120T00017953001.1
MNVSVVSGEGLPDKAYVSIRIGEQRRQAPFRADATPFPFPTSNHATMKVDVFQKVASKIVPLSSMKADPQFHELVEMESGIKLTLGCTSDSQKQDVNKSRSSRHESALKATKYLDEHAVQGTLQSMIHGLLAKQPGDPLAFMISYLSQQKGQDSPAGSPSARAAAADPDAPAEAPAEESIAIVPSNVPDYASMPGLGDEEYPGFPADVCPDEMPDLSKHASIMADVLKKDPSIYATLKEKRTAMGVGFARIIKTGMDNKGHPMVKTCGCVAGDEESFSMFAELFDPVIDIRHGGYPASAKHPTDMDVSKLLDTEIDPTGSYVISTRVRTGRSIRGIVLPPSHTRDSRKELERVVVKALMSLEGELKGDYYPLAGSTSYAPKPTGMTMEEEEQKREDHFLFQEPDSTLLLSGGMGRHWPEGRGIFHNDKKNFLVWVNEEDHTRIISMQMGADIKEVFTRFATGCNAVQDVVKAEGYDFMHNDHLGYVLVCPSNLGTGLRASVMVKIPLLSARHDFKDICKGMGLQARGGAGVDSAAVGGIFDISNSDRLGKSEVTLVNNMISGCAKIVQMEQALEKGEFIYEFMPGLGDEEYPGFPHDVCPDECPDLSNHNSIMTDVLKKDPTLYANLKDKVTSGGVTFARCIKTGMDNKGHPMIKTCGCVAGDEESWTVFADLFDPVIDIRHGGYAKTAKHPTDMDVSKLSTTSIDPTGEYVISTRVRTGRSIRGILLPPACTKEGRRELERVVVKALMTLDGDLKGDYYPLAGSKSYEPKPNGITYEEEETLRKEHFLFQEPDSTLLLSGGMGRHWPDARGIFFNDKKNFLVWVNEEDHTRIISMQMGADIKEVFERFVSGCNAVQDVVKAEGYDFMHNDHLGYVLVCPSNLGTGLRASVMVKLPKLSARHDFRDICKGMRLQARGGAGVDSGAVGGIFDISNSDRLGVSEVALVNNMIEGCAKLIKMEQALEKGEFIYEFMPGLGDEEYPGFPHDVCPDECPDLSHHNSIMTDVLKANPDLYAELKDLKTEMGVGLARCIKTGMDNKGHPMIKTCGIVAGDEESYNVFAKLFDPIIDIRHGGYAADAVHPTDMDISKLDSTDIDPTGQYVISSRVRTGRSVRGLRLPPACTKEDRRELERVVVKALMTLEGDLKGDYYPLAGSKSYEPKPNGITYEEEEKLRNDHFLFQEPDSTLLLSGGMGRHWPDARGIFFNDKKNFLVWVNEEDHTRIISMQMGADIKEVFSRFATGCNAVQDVVKAEGYDFMHNDHLGYVLVCPSNLGTGLRASVMVKIPLLSALPDFKAVCKKFSLQPRGGAGVDSDSSGGVWDISNSDRLGKSEVDLVNNMIRAVRPS